MTDDKVRTFRWVAVLTVVLLMGTVAVPMVSAEGWLRSQIRDMMIPLSFIDAGDVDRDGADEVYTASERGDIFKIWATGKQFFHEAIPSAPDSIQAMVVGDINRDTYDEIYVASKHTYDNGRLYRLTYSGSSWSQDVIHNTFGPSDYPMDLFLGDGNNNGINELYYIEAGGALNYLSQSGSNWFSVTIDSQYPGFFRCLAVGDGDDDGKNEVYIGTDNNQVLRYSYDFGVWSSSTVAEGSSDGYWDYVKDVEIGDPDEDGKTEVVAVIGDESLVAIQFDGSWKMDEIDKLTPIRGINKITMGDGDADGRDELFASATNNIIYYYTWNKDLSKWNYIEVSWSSLPDDVNDLVVTEVDGSPDFMEIYAPCEDGKVYRFSKDVDPPAAPVVWSDTHPEKTWTNKTQAIMEWSMPESDPSGIIGFSYHFFTGSPIPPDQINDHLGDDYLYKSQPLPDSDELYFAIMAQDGAGNWGKVTYYGPIYIDTIPPTDLDIIINGDVEYTSTQYVIIEVDAIDESSGLFNMSFSNDGGAYWSDWVSYNNVYSGWDLNHHSPGGVTDGPRNVLLRVQDTAGNVASGASDDIFLDQAAPTDLTLEINDGDRYTNRSIVHLEVSAEDPTGGSKLAYMSFSNDNKRWGPWEIYNTDKSYWDLLNDPGGWDEDGEHKIYFRTQDLAGNIGGPISESIILDRKPPSRLQLIINSGKLVAKNTTLTLSPRAEDVPDHSGLGMMAFKEKDQWTDWEPWSTNTEFMVSKGDGTKFVYFKVKDKAGNVADPVWSFIVLDSKTPKISHVRVIGITDKNAVITWTTDIPANGVVQYGTGLNYNGEKHHSDLSTRHAVTLGGLRPGTEYHFSVESADAAGQSPTVSRDMTFVTKDYPDTLPPTITDLKIEGLTDHDVVISWKTNEPSDTRVKYGTTPQYGMVEGNSKDVVLHRVAIKNLKADTRYYFSSISTDPRGNGPTETGDTFKTLAEPDLEAPTITNLKVIGITDSLAVVTWQTNEPTLSIIEYGFTLGYGYVAVSEQYEKVHRIILTGLQRDAMYHLIVRAIDISGNGPTTSDDYAFFTSNVADDEPPILTNVRAEAITSNTAVISWASDEPADSGVEYWGEGAGESVYDLDMVEIHSIFLSNLDPNSVYHYRVSSYDATGNGPSVSADFSFTTENFADIDPPEIFQLRVEGITNSLAVVMWETNEETTGLVEFGFNTGNYSFEVEEEGLLREHSVVLWDLTAGNDYFLRVQASDSAGNGPSISGEVSFKTRNNGDQTAPAIMDLAVTNVTHNTATIVWLTDEPADSVVEFGGDGQLDYVARDGRFLFQHVMVLQDLDENTTYSFTVVSTDPSGNQMQLEGEPFTTDSIFIVTPPPPKPEPVDPNDPTGLEETAPWIALGFIVILAIILTVYMFSKGVFGTSKRSKDKKKRDMHTSHISAHTLAVPSQHGGMVVAGVSDDGMCPHCRTNISLTQAARERADDDQRKEETRVRREEARRRREEATAKHKRRLEDIEKRVSSLSTTKKTTRHGEMPVEEHPDTDGEAIIDEDERLEDELEDLYDEVEEEEDIDDPIDSTSGWTPPPSPILAHIKSDPTPVPKKSRSSRVPVRKALGKVPVKTVKCGSCGGRVPVFTKKRPVHIRCPACGKSGTLRGK